MSDIDIGLERLKRRIDGYGRIKEMENYDLEILQKSNLIAQQKSALAGERKKKDFYISVQTNVYKLQKIDQNIALAEKKVENLGGLNPSKDVWENLPQQLELKNELNEKRGGIKECEDKSEFIDKQINLAQDEIKRLQMKIKEAEDMISLKKGEKKEIEAEKSEIEKALFKKNSDLSGKYDDDQKKVLLLLKEQSEARNKRCNILAHFAQEDKCFPSFKDSCDMKDYLDKNKSIILVVKTAEDALNDLEKEKRILENNQARRFQKLDEEQKKMLRLFGQSYDNISTPRPISDEESEDDGCPQNGLNLNKEGNFSPPAVESEESLNCSILSQSAAETSNLANEVIKVGESATVQSIIPVDKVNRMCQGAIGPIEPVAGVNTSGQGALGPCGPINKVATFDQGAIGPSGQEDEVNASGHGALVPCGPINEVATFNQGAIGPSGQKDEENASGHGALGSCGPINEVATFDQGVIGPSGQKNEVYTSGQEALGPCGQLNEVATFDQGANGSSGQNDEVYTSGQEALGPCGQLNKVATFDQGANGPSGQKDEVYTSGQGALGPCGQLNEVATFDQGANGPSGQEDKVGNFVTTLKKQDGNPVSKKSGNRSPSLIEKCSPQEKGCPETDFLAPLTPQTPPGMSSKECEAAVRTITLDIGKTQEFMQVCLNESFDSEDQGDTYLNTDLNTPQPAFKGDTEDRDILNVLLQNDGKTLPAQQRTAQGLQDFYDAECGRQGGILVENTQIPNPIDDTQIPIPTLDYMSISPKQSEGNSNNDREDNQVESEDDCIMETVMETQFDPPPRPIHYTGVDKKTGEKCHFQRIHPCPSKDNIPGEIRAQLTFSGGVELYLKDGEEAATSMEVLQRDMKVFPHPLKNDDDEEEFVRSKKNMVPPAFSESNNAEPSVLKNSPEIKGSKGKNEMLETYRNEPSSPQAKGPQAKSLQTNDPKATSPQATGPQATGSKTTGPETTSLKTTDTKITSPQATCPQATSSKTRGPQEKSPQRKNPKATSPQIMGPHSKNPQAMSPQAIDPKAIGPQATGTNSTGPHSKSPEATGPYTKGPNTTDSPKATSPKATELKATSPKATGPKTTGSIPNKNIDYTDPLALGKNAAGPSKPLDKVSKLSKIATGQSGPVGQEKPDESLQQIKVIESTSKKERDLQKQKKGKTIDLTKKSKKRALGKMFDEYRDQRFIEIINESNSQIDESFIEKTNKSLNCKAKPKDESVKKRYFSKDPDPKNESNTGHNKTKAGNSLGHEREIEENSQKSLSSDDCRRSLHSDSNSDNESSCDSDNGSKEKRASKYDSKNSFHEESDSEYGSETDEKPKKEKRAWRYSQKTEGTTPEKRKRENSCEKDQSSSRERESYRERDSYQKANKKQREHSHDNGYYAREENNYHSDLYEPGAIACSQSTSDQRKVERKGEFHSFSGEQGYNGQRGGGSMKFTPENHNFSGKRGQRGFQGSKRSDWQSERGRGGYPNSSQGRGSSFTNTNNTNQSRGGLAHYGFNQNHQNNAALMRKTNLSILNYDSKIIKSRVLKRLCIACDMLTRCKASQDLQAHFRNGLCRQLNQNFIIDCKNNMSYTCKFCSLSFEAFEIAASHLFKLHPTEHVECNQCDEKITFDDLKSHKLFSHLFKLENNYFSCKKCHRKSLAREFILHISEVHNYQLKIINRAHIEKFLVVQTKLDIPYLMLEKEQLLVHG